MTINEKSTFKEHCFSAESVVAYLEENYDLTFERIDAKPERNYFGKKNRYYAEYDKRLKINVVDAEFSDGEPFVGLGIDDTKDKTGIGCPCRDMDIVIKSIDRFQIEKKTGFEEITLF